MWIKCGIPTLTVLFCWYYSRYFQNFPTISIFGQFCAPKLTAQAALPALSPQPPCYTTAWIYKSLYQPKQDGSPYLAGPGPFIIAAIGILAVVGTTVKDGIF